MKKKIAMIAVPLILICLAVGALLSIPVVYYGNMLLVIVLHIKPTEQQIIGTYKATTDLGEAHLVVNKDHTFLEIISPTNGLPERVTGGWKPMQLESVGFQTQFFPYIGVQHDKFQHFAYGTPNFEKNLLGHVSIEEDPDWGVYFYKEK